MQMLTVINITTIVLLIVLLYVLLWYIDHPWEFPLQSRARRVRMARAWIDRVEEGQRNWPDFPRLDWRYIASVRRRYLDD